MHANHLDSVWVKNITRGFVAVGQLILPWPTGDSKIPVRFDCTQCHLSSCFGSQLRGSSVLVAVCKRSLLICIALKSLIGTSSSRCRIEERASPVRILSCRVINCYYCVRLFWTCLILRSTICAQK